MALVGRDQDIRDLLACPGGVVVVAGDSGVGKSEMLRAGQERSSSTLAPPPVGLRSAPGALQRGLLEALGAAVAEATQGRTAAERVGNLLVQAAGRVVDVRLKDLASGVVRHLLGIVSTRVSPELADVFSTCAHQLITTIDSELTARINNASDPDVVDLVCGFASEVRALASGRDLVLALDDGDRLDEGDRRRLADLPLQLPDGVVVRLAFSTWSAQTRDQVDELTQLGVKSVELKGLDEAAVREWLLSSGLPGEWASEVWRTTNGYALHVAAAIDLLSEVGSISALDGMQRSDVIEATTRRQWRELGTVEKVAAERLCAFPTPLTAEDAADYLGVDVSVWHTLQRTLADSRIFTGEPPWFHELRRRIIWSEIMADAARDETLGRALAFREDQLALPAPPAEAFVQYAQLSAQQPSILEQNPQIAAVINADRDEVAIAAALIELAEPSSLAFIADTVLLYAQQVFAATGDLVAALQRLEEKGFVQITSNPQATALAPTWGSIEVVRLFAGRAAAELGRLPTPQLATAVFEMELRPRLGTFRSGTYGIGSPRIWELSRQAAQLQRVQPNGTVIGGKLGPNLLLRYRYDAISLYAAIAYDDERERDAAAQRLDGWATVNRGHELTVVDCLVDPESSVCSLRFFLAMERLTGTTLVNGINGPSSHPPKLAVAVSFDEEMRQRSLTLDTVRRLCSPEERLAYSLEEPIGYVYRGTAENSETAHVIGRTGVTHLEGDVPTFIGNPLFRFELARHAEVGPGERLGLITWHQGVQQEDPVLHELTWAFQQAAKFNEHQRRVLVRLEQDELERRFAEASARMASDALELMSVLGLEVSEDELRKRGLRGSTTYVVIHLDRPDPHWVPAANATITAATVANGSGEHSAAVHLIASEDPDPHGGLSFAAVRAAFADRFGFDPTDVERMTYGAAIETLAELLGYRSSEVRFEY
jgi:hypothetical protein